MSKELYFTDGNNEVKYLDTTASFNLAITQDGSAFDLTNATAIDVKVANDTGYVFTKSIDMATIKQPLAGLITMPVDAEVMNALVPDDYTIEVWVTLSSLITPGSQEGLTDDGSTTNTNTSSTTATTTYNAIFPSDDPQGFTITENVMSDSGDVIPVMSLDEFQQEFDQLKTDLTNKVSTLQGPKGDTGPQGPKGDQGIQGPKGDTGQGLDIKGKVDTTSQLPTTASEGDGYLVAGELYIWMNNAWKDCGQIQGPAGKDGTQVDLSNYATQQQLATKADDSKVVHNSGDETIGGTKTFTKPIKGTIDGINYRYSAVGDDLNTSYMNDSVIYTGGNKEAHAPAGTDGTWAIVRNYNSDTTNGAQSYYDTNSGVLYVRTRNGTSTYTPWVHVANTNDVTTAINTATATKADDSKVSALQTQVNNSAVGTNLLVGTGNSSNITGANVSNQTTNVYLLSNGYNVSTLASAFGTQFTISFDWLVSGSSPSGTFNAMWNNFPWGSGVGNLNTVSSSNTSGHFSNTFSLSTDSENIATGVCFRLDNFVGTLTISNVKLEKGSVATDWCPNPSEILTQIDYSKIKAAIVALGGSLS